MSIEGLVTKTQRKVKLNSYSDHFEIHPFGDVHFDADACDSDRFDDDLKIMRTAHNPLYIGLGDYLDFVSTSSRKKIKNAGLKDYDFQKLDKFAKEDISRFTKKLSFMRGRLLGMCGGNHDWDFEDGECGTQKMCQSLGCEYLGWLSVVRISIEVFGRFTAIEMVVCHGKAGGKLPGTSINQVEDLHKIFPASDLYIGGHDHQRGAWPISSLFTTVNVHDKECSFKIKEKTQWLCRSGSYLKAYELGSGGYVARSLRRPSALGKITIKVSVQRKRRDDGGDDMHPVIRVEA